MASGAVLAHEWLALQQGSDPWQSYLLCRLESISRAAAAYVWARMSLSGPFSALAFQVRQCPALIPPAQGLILWNYLR